MGEERKRKRIIKGKRECKSRIEYDEKYSVEGTVKKDGQTALARE